MNPTYWICIADVFGVVHAFELGQWRQPGISPADAVTACERQGYSRVALIPRGGDRLPRSALSCSVCLTSRLVHREDVTFSDSL